MLRVQDEAFRRAFEVGYAATTVDAIAAATDVSPSTVYRAFGTKEGIFLWDELELPTRELFEGELAHHSPVDASIAVVEAIGGLEFHLSDAEMRARFEFLLAEPALRSSLSEAFRHFEADLARQFVRGGTVGPIEARITAAASNGRDARSIRGVGHGRASPAVLLGGARRGRLAPDRADRVGSPSMSGISWPATLNRLISGSDLTRDEAYEAMAEDHVRRRIRIADRGAARGAASEGRDR